MTPCLLWGWRVAGGSPQERASVLRSKVGFKMFVLGKMPDVCSLGSGPWSRARFSG